MKPRTESEMTRMGLLKTLGLVMTMAAVWNLQRGGTLVEADGELEAVDVWSCDAIVHIWFPRAVFPNRAARVSFNRRRYTHDQLCA